MRATAAARLGVLVLLLSTLCVGSVVTGLNAQEKLPLELEGTLLYQHKGDEQVGATNVPACQSTEWAAMLRLKLRRKEATQHDATY